MLNFEVKGAGLPVILIHGFPNDLSSWSGIDAALAADFQVISVDLPGAGKSPSFSGALDISKMASEILQLLDRLAIRQAVLIGHSMGGYTAIECLSAFPERIKGISMVHSLASSDTEEKRVMRLKAIDLMKRSEAARHIFLKEMAANLFARDFVDAHPEIVTSVVTNGMKLSVHDITNFYAAIMNRKDHRSLLKNNPVPVQWIIGTEDAATPMELALAQAKESDVNVVNIYNGTGHMSMFENKEALIKDLSEFCHFCKFYN